MAPPPPPPPPFCLPFGGKKRRPLSPSRTFSEKTFSTHRYGEDGRVLPRSPSPDRSEYSRTSGSSYTRSDRSNSYSPTATITSKEGLEFKTDSESYNVPLAPNRAVSPPPKQPKKRGWGYGWGLGKQREKEKEKAEKEKEAEKDAGVDAGFWGGKGKLLSRKKTLPSAPLPPMPPVEEEDDDFVGAEETESFTGRTMSMSHVSTSRSARPMRPPLSPIPSESPHESPRSSKDRSPLGPSRSNTQRSGGSGRTGASSRTAGSGSRSYSHSGSPRSMQQQMFERKPSSRSARSSPPKQPRSPAPSDSQSTLVGSAYERKVNDIDEPRERVDTTERLHELRAFMAKDNLDY